jgi:hypothetical protein
VSERESRILSLLFLAALPSTAWAGGPLVLKANGDAFVWSTAAPIAYRTDNGPLSATVTQAQAQARVDAMFNKWESVPSSSISYLRAGFIQDVGAFTDGDVSTLNEYDAVEGDCLGGSQSPIVYDANGQIFIDLGLDENSVIGFAGPCAFTGQGLIVSGQAVMNGRFQDGIDTAANPELTTADFNATFIHEFGHFSGLDHSQINVGCASGGCGSDELIGLPTMFPFLLSDVGAPQESLSIDDVAWISKLYPAASFSTTHGHISGTVFFSDGESHAQLVNVVARPLDDPTTGEDESITRAASNVSGYKFRFFLGNPINDDGNTAGSDDPVDIGLFEIPLPAGQYTIEVESIDPAFEDGSSVGGPVRIDMPGSAPPSLGPFVVVAGSTTPAGDVVLIGTPPRFDQFEGP